ncbi:sensor histidine kinase [Brachybacterium hainanense]|uniref:histidine kinase n=1 Tax=Brachybacterium hainanense TaxID=1541174 RepID=A0ABV6RAI4_9MICO
MQSKDSAASPRPAGGRIPARRWWLEGLVVLCGATEVLTGLLLMRGTLSIVAAAAGAVLVAALLFRHRHWRWLLPLVLALNACAVSFTVLVAGAYGYATRSSSRVMIGLVTLLACLAAGTPPLVVSQDRTTIVFVALMVLMTLTAAVLGMYTSARRELLDQLRERAEQAEHGRSVAEEQARRAERTRIAREMHDIVAHKISLIALQAGALEVNQNLDQAQVSAAAGLMRSTAADALTELRQVLGVLRGTEESAPLAPQPTWDDVRRLVTTSQEAGIRVELYDFIDAHVPDPLARTAYRVVQEGLTNIHKHARHTKARVALIGEPGDELIVEVSNLLPRGFTTDLPGARMGLSGIETRVSHAGGTITAGPTADGRFEVKAVIPWPAQTP